MDGEKKSKKGNKNKKKGKQCEEDAFSQGFLVALAGRLPEDGDASITVSSVGEKVEALLGKKFDDDEDKSMAFLAGLKAGEEKLGAKGCSPQCEDNPLDAECQECCRNYDHAIDWSCGTDQAADCCDEDKWTAECWDTKSDANNQHACSDCYGYRSYGYGRRYGGYRSYGYGRRLE